MRSQSTHKPCPACHQPILLRSHYCVSCAAFKRRRRQPIRWLSSTCRAYIGALIDTDGSASLYQKKRHYSPTPRISIAFRVGGREGVEIISAMLRILQCGSVGISYRQGRGSSPCLLIHWQITDHHRVVGLAKQIAPYSIKAAALLNGIANYSRR